MKLKKQQTGAVLLVGLIMVLVLSVVVAASTKTTILQQKMTSNLRDKELSFQAAESALRSGEVYLQDTSEADLSYIFDNTNGLYAFDQDRHLDNETEWTNISKILNEKLFQLKHKAAMVIEELPPLNAIGNSVQAGLPVASHYYRVTSTSKGGTDNSLTILQSTYKK